MLNTVIYFYYEGFFSIRVPLIIKQQPLKKQNQLNPFLKSLENITTDWISKLAPNNQINTFMKKQIAWFQSWWGPKNKLTGLVLFLLIGGTNQYFTILFSYWFSITTLKNALVSNQHNLKVAVHSYFY